VKKKDQKNLLHKKFFCHIKKKGEKNNRLCTNYTNVISSIMSEEVYNGAIG